MTNCGRKLGGFDTVRRDDSLYSVNEVACYRGRVKGCVNPESKLNCDSSSPRPRLASMEVLGIQCHRSTSSLG